MSSPQTSKALPQNPTPMPATTAPIPQNTHFEDFLHYRDENGGLMLTNRPVSPPGIFDGIQVVIDKVQSTKETAKGGIKSFLWKNVGTPIKEKAKSKLKQRDDEAAAAGRKKNNNNNGWAMKVWRVAGRATGAQDEIEEERWEALQAVEAAQAAKAAAEKKKSVIPKNHQHGAVNYVQEGVNMVSLPGQFPMPSQLGQGVQPVQTPYYTDGYNQLPPPPPLYGPPRSRGYGDLPVGVNEDMTTLSGEIHDRLQPASLAQPSSSSVKTTTTATTTATAIQGQAVPRLRSNRRTYASLMADWSGEEGLANVASPITSFGRSDPSLSLPPPQQQQRDKGAGVTHVSDCTVDRWGRRHW